MTESQGFTPAQDFIYEAPRRVKAVQWTKDERQQLEVLRWLLNQNRRFTVEYNSKTFPVDRDRYLIIENSRRDQIDQYVTFSDWIVREGPGAYTVWQDPDFQANYRVAP